MKKIAATLVLLTALFNCGHSKSIKKTDSPYSSHQVRIYVNGEVKLPSSAEIDNVLNKKIPAILEKISKTGIDPCKVFVTNMKGISSK
ncbi:MAG: hypothetical protein AB9922_01080 [Bacteroidales bacterium]